MKKLEKSVEQEVIKNNLVEDAVLIGGENTIKEVDYAKECPMCKSGVKHMFVVLGKDGVPHVHAPWGNRYLMNEFMEAIYREQARYNRAVK